MVLDLEFILCGPRVGLDLQFDFSNERGLGESIILCHGEEVTVCFLRDVEVKVFVMRVKLFEFEVYIVNVLVFDGAEVSREPIS